MTIKGRDSTVIVVCQSPSSKRNNWGPWHWSIRVRGEEQH
ncbi:uncharacterized protein PgNI_03380 [Pyricularia grisea]|uniref:Uncharacterized protein n=1 Tax=Pyricularia grisea TaxID=148305 RepID=A0A6P8BEE8_PYRGI|nr:uncharacterized protein PgNI_03380 [Pyricularia grisea]TLD14198.1 hypothetical protein PgNI_03380 [Pyricularia grisea]